MQGGREGREGRERKTVLKRPHKVLSIEELSKEELSSEDLLNEETTQLKKPFKLSSEELSMETSREKTLPIPTIIKICFK